MVCQRDPGGYVPSRDYSLGGRSRGARDAGLGGHGMKSGWGSGAHPRKEGGEQGRDSCGAQNSPFTTPSTEVRSSFLAILGGVHAPPPPEGGFSALHATLPPPPLPVRENQRGVKLLPPPSREVGRIPIQAHAGRGVPSDWRRGCDGAGRGGGGRGCEGPEPQDFSPCCKSDQNLNASLLVYSLSSFQKWLGGVPSKIWSALSESPSVDPPLLLLFFAFSPSHLLQHNKPPSMDRSPPILITPSPT